MRAPRVDTPTLPDRVGKAVEADCLEAMAARAATAAMAAPAGPARRAALAATAATAATLTDPLGWLHQD